MAVVFLADQRKTCYDATCASTTVNPSIDLLLTELLEGNVELLSRDATGNMSAPALRRSPTLRKPTSHHEAVNCCEVIFTDVGVHSALLYTLFSPKA